MTIRALCPDRESAHVVACALVALRRYRVELAPEGDRVRVTATRDASAAAPSTWTPAPLEVAP